MKECRYCKKSYPESFFGVALTTENKVYYRHKCKFCYQNTKNILKGKYKDWLQNYKKTCKCKVCKTDDYRVLEFHHLDKNQKDFSISFAYNNRVGLERMKREIEKCDILCANCHRITHWEENGW